jgi:hypothetical protein
MMRIAVRQPVVDRGCDHALARRTVAELGIHALVAHRPITAMDQQDRRPQSRLATRRQAEIEPLRRVGAVRDIGFDL